MQHPHRRGVGCRGEPRGNGSPGPARARAPAPADTAEHGSRRGPRGAARPACQGASSTACSPRPLGPWRASGASVAAPGGRVAATRGRPGRPRRVPPRPRRAGQAGVERLPHARVGQPCTAGGPTGRAAAGHRVAGGGRGWDSQPHGTGPQVEDASRGRGGETRRPDAVQRAPGRAGYHGNGSARFGGGPGEQEGKRPRPRPTQSPPSLPLPAAADARRSASLSVFSVKPKFARFEVGFDIFYSNPPPL